MKEDLHKMAPETYKNFENLINKINKDRQQERGFTPNSSLKRQDNRRYDALSLLTGLLMQIQPGTHHNGRGRGRDNNISNNSEWFNDKDVVTHDSPNSFLSMDRYPTYQI